MTEKPRKDWTWVSVQLPKRLHAEVKEAAKKTNRSMTNLIHVLVYRGLKTYAQPKDPNAKP